VNDALRAGATVARIERRRVVITENGSPRELLLSEDEVTLAAAPAPTPARRRPVPRRAPPQRREVPAPFAPEADVRNPATLFSQARILPKYEDGAMVGVQLNAIKPGSLFEKAGFQNGDVIRELNGIKIDSPEQSAKILLEFVDAKEFSVQVQNAQGVENRTFTVPD
jgi:type II secretion system protein C